MSRTVRWTVCWLALLGLLGMAGCGKAKNAQAKAEKEEEGWNPRGAYKPPPGAGEAPKPGGNVNAGDIVGSAGQNVRQGVERQKAKGILENIGLFYQQYHLDNGKVPANENEFINYIQREAPHVVEAIKNGYFVVNWGSPLDGNRVLAYEKTSYAGARTVLLGTRTIKVMPDAEFEAALRGGQ
jgi:hypothetical protein